MEVQFCQRKPHIFIHRSSLMMIKNRNKNIKQQRFTLDCNFLSREY